MKKHACGKISTQTKFFIYLFLIVMTIVFSSCSKQVYTTFYEEEDFTEFKTHPFKIKKGNKEPIQLIATRRCDGQTLCSAFEIKIYSTVKDNSLTSKVKILLLRQMIENMTLIKEVINLHLMLRVKIQKGLLA